MYLRFKKHKLARISLIVLGLLYVCRAVRTIYCPLQSESYDSKYVNAPPMKLRFVDADGKFHHSSVSFTS